MEEIKIFNLFQANIFIQKGCVIKNVGISKGKFFVAFQLNNCLNELLKKWQNRELEY